MDESHALTPLEPPAPVPLEAVNAHAPLNAEQTAKLDAQVTEFVDAFVSTETTDEAFNERLSALSALGAADVQRSANVSNRLLERPAAAKKAMDPKAGVSKSLGELRTVVEKLDPSTQGALLAPRRLLGIIPFGSKIKGYFDRYQSAQSQLDAIIQTLFRGKDELMRDNAAIESEKRSLSDAMQKLRAAIYLCERIDAELEVRAYELEATDPARAKALREEVLLAARQRRVDLLTQLAVDVQGHQVLDLVRRNNIELIKGVDRATTTTVSALRTAVTASQALAGQRLVLNQISALNATTGAMIESTSQLLGTQGVAIHTQASEATIDLARLKAAFTNIYAAIDAVDSYKAKALTTLAATADAFGAEIGRAEAKLATQRSPRALPGGNTPAA